MLTQIAGALLIVSMLIGFYLQTFFGGLCLFIALFGGLVYFLGGDE